MKIKILILNLLCLLQKLKIKRVFLQLALFIILFQTSLSAETLTKKTTIQSYNFSVTTAYFGQWITHPGFTAGIEYIPFQNKYSKMLLTGNLGFYIHPLNHTAFFFNNEIGYRYTTPIGFFFDSFIGTGYKHEWLHSYKDVVIYEHDSSGKITKAANYGYPYFTPNFSMGWGWDLSRKSRLPLLYYCRIGVQAQYPYNNYILPRIYLTTGFSYCFTIKK